METEENGKTHPNGKKSAGRGPPAPPPLPYPTWVTTVDSVTGCFTVCHHDALPPLIQSNPGEEKMVEMRGGKNIKNL